MNWPIHSSILHTIVAIKNAYSKSLVCIMAWKGQNSIPTQHQRPTLFDNSTKQNVMSFENDCTFNRKALYTILCNLIMISIRKRTSQKTLFDDSFTRMFSMSHVAWQYWEREMQIVFVAVLSFVIFHSHLAAFSFSTICDQNANDQAHNTQKGILKKQKFSSSTTTDTWYKQKESWRGSSEKQLTKMLSWMDFPCFFSKEMSNSWTLTCSLLSYY